MGWLLRLGVEDGSLRLDVDPDSRECSTGLNHYPYQKILRRCPDPASTVARVSVEHDSTMGPFIAA